MLGRILIFTMILSTGTSAAQETDWLEKMEQFSSFVESRESADYLLGPGDLLEISVFGVDDFNREARVSSSGSITVPFLGRITAEGITGAELEEALTRLIIEKDLIRNPQVSVFIKEYRSQPVYILGAVNQPGQYMITRWFTILDAVTLAGGLKSQIAENYALVQRRRTSARKERSEDRPADSQESHPEILRVDLRGLLEEGDIAMNIPIVGGDIIQIPERKVEIFYVVGDVGRAGAYEFPRDDERELMATQALAWAGGPGKTANMKGGTLIRYDDSGQLTTIAINFQNIIKGKEPDFAVHPRDVIFIPGSIAKTLGYGFLNIVPSTVSWAIVWGAWRR